MTGDEPDPGVTASETDRVTADLRRDRERRRLAEIFGDVLPESTSDDQDEPSVETGSAGSGGDGRGGHTRDAEILRDVPPHHT